MNPTSESQHRSLTGGSDPKPRPESITVQKQGLVEMEAPHKASSKSTRKRTKTGCLTCRQRRIKCGEEKPVCKNCIKSKRECKGYAQRLIFKAPLGIPGIRKPIPTLTEQIQSLPLTGKYDTQIDFQQTSAGTDGPILAPKLTSITGPVQDSLPQPSSGSRKEFHGHNAPPSSHSNFSSRTPSPWTGPGSHSKNPSSHPPDFLRQSRQDISGRAGTGYPCGLVDQRHSSPLEGGISTAQESTSSSIRPSYAHPGPHTLEPSFPSGESVLPSPETEGHQRASVQRRIFPPLSYMDEDDDDDYYDVESDEEAEEQVRTQNFNQLSLIIASANRDQRQIRSFTTYLNEPNVLASYNPSYGSSPLNNPKTARVFLHFIHATGPILSIFERHPIDPSTMLGTPVPMAQQGLWTYTLPFKAFDHPALLQAILALSSLHIACLQQSPITISLKHYHYALKRVGKAVGLPNRRKQLGTLAATLLLAYYEVMTADHFKWNSHLAGSAQLVREIDFAGIARDLRAQRHIRWLERQQENNKPYSYFTDGYMFNNSVSSDDPFAELEGSINENIIGLILGRAINYDEFGEVENDCRYTSSRRKHFTRKDIENFRIQCDLFWWYCKQDFIQSIVSGSSLFLPYSQWGQCPPRAGLGRIDAIYGSGDHLTLLMGRLADFGDRDRKRKLKAAKTSGSEWRPDARLMKFMGRFARGPPGDPGQGPPNHSVQSDPPSFGGPPHGGSNSQPSMGQRKGSQTTNPDAQQSPGSSPGSSPGGPPMYGMIPSNGPRRLPSAFATNACDDPDAYTHNEMDENISYEEAESEWESILAAFEMFGQALGPDFMPLPPDSTLPIFSPFGPALQYRTHNIGALWALYYCGRILLQRLHPCMPPAMMMAAGVAAPTTAEFAQIIGKITAGIYCPQSSYVGVEGLSPTLGSCLIEVAVPMFFAGVQYMDASQRAWTVTVLGELSRLTGWKSADAIARGCERVWTTAAKQGRGPPYRPNNEQTSSWTTHATTEEVQLHINGNSERRFVTIRDPPYLSWAMGILSLGDHVF
ncbi:hypothetical protein AOCH_001773 [Aspergillus ochraceoroseus]|uniref:Zn(2)-C6 fungal-type domain-containing protein n=2 Tax=Aspergillus ochraceoroseus TaxID=138278 RepID=A0A0F8WZM4_9EURO|nr:hypothetical protein AOCH_001773 [Aspergillus ochraceoroseus]